MLQLNQGFFDVPNVQQKGGVDIQFATGDSSNECNCVVALGGGMVDINAAATSTAPAGAPTTSDATKVTGQTTYAAPTFANAETVGTPPQVNSQTQFLTLTPNELGIIANTSGTAAAPNGQGLKLRVECSSQSGKVKLVVLAGSSSIETVLADGIGGGISGCP